MYMQSIHGAYNDQQVELTSVSPWCLSIHHDKTLIFLNNAYIQRQIQVPTLAVAEEATESQGATQLNSNDFLLQKLNSYGEP